MGEDPADYLAARVRALHPISGRATFEELLAICRARGLPVFSLEQLSQPGFLLERPELAILLRRDAGPNVLAHETFHGIIADNAAHDIEYTAPEWQAADPEGSARRFETLLCGTSEEQPPAEDPFDILIRGLGELGRELGRPIPMSISEAEARRLTPEAARGMLAWIRKQAEEGVI